MAMNWLNRTIHHGKIACKYAGTLHAVAINLDQVHARRTNTQKLVERKEPSAYVLCGIGRGAPRIRAE